MVHFQSSSSKAPAPIFLLGDGDKEVLFLMFAILACFCSISSCFFNSSSLSIASAFSCYAFLIFLISCAFFSFSWTSGVKSLAAKVLDIPAPAPAVGGLFAFWFERLTPPVRSDAFELLGTYVLLILSTDDSPFFLDLLLENSMIFCCFSNYSLNFCWILNSSASSSAAIFYFSNLIAFCLSSAETLPLVAELAVSYLITIVASCVSFFYVVLVSFNAYYV